MPAGNQTGWVYRRRVVCLIGAVGEGEGTVGGDGEFKITLVELHGDRHWSLYPHLEVYGEGVGALRRGIDAGLLDALGPVNSRDEFARRLLAIGLIEPLRQPAAGKRIVSPG